MTTHIHTYDMSPSIDGALSLTDRQLLLSVARTFSMLLLTTHLSDTIPAQRANLLDAASLQSSLARRIVNYKTY
jgi:hypothetical protein